jgi:hypothetical protein
MRKRRYPISALLGVLGALGLASVSAAAPISQSLVATLSPAKQSKTTFGGASLHTVISTTFDNFATSQSPRETAFTIDPNIKFTNGNVPACQLGQIQGLFTAQAQAACPGSIVGSGSVEVNGGAISGTVTIFAGGATTMYVQTDIGPGATSLTIVGSLAGRTLTFSNIPNTPGLVLSNFDVLFNKRQVGKTKDTALFYVSARCKNKRWTSSESTTFYSGETLSASASQSCKQGAGQKGRKKGGGRKPGGKKPGGKKRKKPRRRDGNYSGSTTQQAVTPSFRKIRFTVKKGKVTLTTEPTVARGSCVSTPVFTLGGTTVRKKLSKKGTFTFTHTFLGTKIDKIHGKFVSTDEVQGYAVYNFSAQDLCSGGRARVNFSAKHE